MKNQSIGRDLVWQDGDYRYTEIIAQEYSNCKFSAGYVEGHPVDKMYVRLEKNGEVTTHLLLRPDEVAALGWIASGLLWTEHVRGVPKRATDQTSCRDRAGQVSERAHQSG